MTNGLHAIDWILIFCYASGMVALGWYYGRRQRDTDEYYTGNRSMNPALIGISLFATLMSTISYLAGPGELIQNGPLMMAGILATPINYLVVGYLLIPALMKYRLTSAYELLEMRVGLSTRLLGAVMFIACRLIWMAVLLNFAANALLVMTGWPNQWLFAVALIIGTIAMLYSTMGGIRAVVITDLAQFLLLFGGAIAVVVIISVRMGGISWIPTSWDPTWPQQPFFSLDPHVRLTFVGVIVMQSLWTICTAGGDQTAIQRYMATANARAARASFLVNALVGVAVGLLLAVVGSALLGYFQYFPNQVSPELSGRSRADDWFPFFIAHHLPVGLSGLVVSGMFAAAMSSVDSGVNSISAVVLTDFVDRFRQDALSRSTHVKLAKVLAVSVGLIVIAGSMLIEFVPGNLTIVSKRVAGLLIAPLFTLFFIALFVPFRTPWGTNLGALGSLATAILVAFWDPLVGDRAISVTWIHLAALTVGISGGSLISWLARIRPRATTN